MTLETLASACASNACPTIYAYPGDLQVLVQGHVTSGPAHGVALPDGETLVQVPADLILQAAERLRASLPQG
jgi:hypothetical protein